MLRYAIGLDIGITSVGAAVVSLNSEDEPNGIIRLSSRIFDKPEVPKTGETLASVRRGARSARRILRRRHHRKERIRELIVSDGLISQSALNALFDGKKLEDIYALRTKALDMPVSRDEFARILIHLSQRRGFKSNRKADKKGKDGELLTAVQDNIARMSDGNYRTAGEMFYKDPLFAETKRNKGGEYKGTVNRDMIEAEAREIFRAQRELGGAFASKSLEEAYLGILLGQRSFDDGPGKGSPYAISESQTADRIGICTFEKEELRAAKATYSYEYFSLLQNVNHLRLVTDSKSEPLTDEQRDTIIKIAHKKAALSYGDIRKALGIPESIRFNISYNAPRKNKTESFTYADAEKKKFEYLKAYHTMRKAFDVISKDYFSTVSQETRDAIGSVLSMYHTQEKITEKLEHILDPAELEAVSSLEFSGFGHLSVKALKNIIPYLEQGLKYNEACEKAGYDFNNGKTDKEKSSLLPALNIDNVRLEITSPIAIRAISQTIKVVNAIIREQGHQPVYINIELARDMAKSFQERNDIIKAQNENQSRNEKIKARLVELGFDPKPLNIVKMKLYDEQGRVCPYCQKPIDFEKVFADNTYYQVDHIVPYSKSFNDSYNNKVLDTSVTKIIPGSKRDASGNIIDASGKIYR